MKPYAPRTRHAATRPRKGASLVLALILVVVLSATAAAALTLVGGERRVVEDGEAAAEAHAMARSAYNQFVANPTGSLATFNPLLFTGPDSAYFAFSDGYAWVSVQRVRPSVNLSAIVFVIRSRAVRTVGRPQTTPVAERTFAQYAVWQTGAMPTLAAWTSMTGLLKSGGSGTISGVDNCGAVNSVAGVAAPTLPGYIQTGGASVPAGSPNIYDMGPQADANELIKIDWPSIIAGTSLTPDLVLPGAAWPSFANVNYWPVIYVDQVADWSLPGDGRGMLIVRHNLTMGGSVTWDGVVLVGGRIVSSGNNTVAGAVVSGLNVLIGEIVAPSDVGSGTKTFIFNSCNVTKAGGKFVGLAPLRNTSADNWRSY